MEKELPDPTHSYITEDLQRKRFKASISARMLASINDHLQRATTRLVLNKVTPQLGSRASNSCMCTSSTTRHYLCIMWVITDYDETTTHGNLYEAN